MWVWFEDDKFVIFVFLLGVLVYCGGIGGCIKCVLFFIMWLFIVEDELKVGDYLFKGLMEFGFVVDFVCIGFDGLF